MGDAPNKIVEDIEAIGRIGAVPSLLRVLCETTGMRFAAVARVTESSWTACAVVDDIQFGLQPGGQLDLATTLCHEVRQAGTPIVIDHASKDPKYCNHHTPRIYQIESYVSVPIILSSGEYFGNLCAIDPMPAKVSEPHIVAMFTLFAQLIALQLDADRIREQAQAALLDERARGELRDQFIAILGHDLRNPLGAVGACADLLKRKSTDATTLALADRISVNVHRMGRLIGDVLDFARSQLGGGISVRFDTVHDLEKALQDVVAELRDTHPERSFDVRLAIDRAVPADRARIQQLVSNLLGNALAHGAPASPITLTATVEDDHLVITVWNDGDPIPPESLDKIFFPFWRQSTAPHREGLGLGLHISRQIVEAHGGRLRVTSTAREGTTFIAQLPLTFRSVR